jgi:hypothetical protein
VKDKKTDGANEYIHLSMTNIERLKRIKLKDGADKSELRLRSEGNETNTIYKHYI